MTQKGFTIEVSSRYDGWWRYNVTLMCGCFDASGERTGFVSAESHIADAGSNLRKKPTEIPDLRTVTLDTPACQRIVLYIYIVPHTLPTSSDIASTLPFEVDLVIRYSGRELRKEQRKINQWSGASIELKIENA